MSSPARSEGPDPPPIRLGPQDLDRDTRSLRPGELGVVRLDIQGHHAEVETRSVTPHSNRPGSSLDCGVNQIFVLSKEATKQWKVMETRVTQC